MPVSTPICSWIEILKMLAIVFPSFPKGQKYTVGVVTPLHETARPVAEKVRFMGYGTRTVHFWTTPQMLSSSSLLSSAAFFVLFFFCICHTRRFVRVCADYDGAFSIDRGR